MIYPDMSTEHWCKKYQLDVVARPCNNCAKLITTARPFASGSWRGLKALEHGCGATYLLSTAVLINELERDEWAKLARGGK